jgi:hypothetical protein
MYSSSTVRIAARGLKLHKVACVQVVRSSPVPIRRFASAQPVAADVDKSKDVSSKPADKTLTPKPENVVPKSDGYMKLESLPVVFSDISRAKV